MSQRAFALEKVQRKLGDFHLQIDHLALERGYVLGLVGRNGAGKTTTIQVLMNLIYTDTGHVEVLGQTMPAAERDVKRLVGYVSESPGFYDDMTVGWTVDLVRPYYPGWDQALSRHYLDIFELDPRKKVKQLSKGQRVRLALTLALSHRPRLLLLDEPTSGLDPVMRLELIEQIAELIRDENCSVVISSHMTQDIERIADYVAIIADGAVEEYDDTLSLKQRWQRVTGSLVGDSANIASLFRSMKTDHDQFVGITDTFSPEWVRMLADAGATEHEAHGLSLDEVLVALSGKQT